MATFSLDDLVTEYETNFQRMAILPEHLDEADAIVTQISRNKNVYSAIMDQVGIPWQVIGVIHSMEASLNFNTHLHNGDPLTARTVHVPKNRPKGNPPFTFEESAVDALVFEGFDKITDWSLAGTLYCLESYNGFGYRRKNVRINSPYLWSYSDLYSSGKFVEDGVYDPDKVSDQCGAAVLLKRMTDREILTFSGMPHSVPVVVNGEPDPVSAFIQKDNSWIAPRQLKNAFPESDVVAVRNNPLNITVRFKDKNRDFEGMLYHGFGHVDASDLIRDFFGATLVYNDSLDRLEITT